MAQSLSEKMMIKPGARLLTVGLSPGMQAALEPLPAKTERHVTPDGVRYDVVVAEMRDRHAVEQLWPIVEMTARREGAVWLLYPAAGGGIVTDLTRDRGWEPVKADGWEVVSSAVVNDKWNALRFRPRPVPDRGADRRKGVA